MFLSYCILAVFTAIIKKAVRTRERRDEKIYEEEAL